LTKRWLPRSIAATGRRAVGEPHFSVVLAFFNLVALAALIIAVANVGVSILLHPDAAAARYIADGVSLALKLGAYVAAALSIIQLVPGGRRWRDLRQRAGIVNLALICPAVFVLGLVAYLELPASLHTWP
jgi:hypothetical protein